MPATTHNRRLMATVDVKELDSLRWGPMRQLFPAFADDIELGRYLKHLLRTTRSRAVQLEPRREPDGRASTHVFEVYFVDDPA